MVVAVDAMGGDHGPRVVVEGALRALAQDESLEVVLVGDRNRVQPEIDAHRPHPRMGFRHASEVVSMDESPAAALRKKKDSSIRVGIDLVKDGTAQGFVSAGNTGAVMATALLRLRPLPGVDRPGIATIMPSKRDPFVLIDAGANVDCRPLHLVQFAVMGSIYARMVLKRSEPRVGLMSIGEEAAKGNELVKETYRLLAGTGLPFAGNVEGKDMYGGAVDVVVCDGFTGNVTLKVSEGVADTIVSLLRREIQSRFFGRLGYILLKPAFSAFRQRIDYAEYGGAPLLGLRGVCIIGHGRSSAKALANAIGVAAQAIKENLVNVIGSEIERIGIQVSRVD